MSHPRATFPADVIAFHAANGLVRTAQAYGAHRTTLRRWLTENGVEIRKQGPRIGRKAS